MKILKNVLKIFLVAYLFLASIDCLATKRYYYIDVNFISGYKVFDNQLLLNNICTGDSLIISLRHQDTSPFTDAEATQLTWTIDAYLPGDLSIYKSVTANASKTLTFDGGLQENNGTFYIQLDSTGTSQITSGGSISGTFKVTPTFDLGADLSSCVGFSSTLKNVLSSTGVAGVSYLWSTGATTATINVSSPALYAVTVSNYFATVSGSTFNNCATTDNIRFSNYPQAVVDAGGTRYRCFGENLQLNAFFSSQGTLPYSYNWQPNTYLGGVNTIQNPVVSSTNPQNTTIYTLTVTDAHFCKATSSVTVNKNPALSFGINTSGATLCKFDANGNPINLAISTTVAGGTNSSGYTYQWTPSIGLSNATIANPLAYGVSVSGIKYIATVFDTKLCTAKDSIVIKTTSLALKFTNPVLDVLSICSGELISTLQTSRKGGAGGYTFTWSPTDILNRTNDSLYSTKPITSTVKIFAQVTDLSNCADKDSVVVFVKTAPVSQIKKDSTINICTGNSKQVNVLLDADAANYQLNWLPSSISSYNPVIPAAGSAGVQAYLFTITSNLSGCAIASSFNISTKLSTPTEITGPSNINISKGSTRVFLGQDITFSSSVSEFQYLWYLSDGTINLPNTNQNVTVRFDSPGTYVLTLIGTNTDGCISNQTLTIVANKDIKVFAPTVFSPAASDARNQSFKIFYGSNDLVALKVSIFNVVGQKVFESSDINKMLYVDGDNSKGEGWTGDGYPIGVYTWVVEYKLSGGSTEKLAPGTVTLIR